MASRGKRGGRVNGLRKPTAGPAAGDKTSASWNPEAADGAPGYLLCRVGGGRIAVRPGFTGECENRKCALRDCDR
jgi:hypothetical protein